MIKSKKILAVLMAVLSMFSVFAVSSSAVDYDDITTPTTAESPTFYTVTFVTDSVNCLYTPILEFTYDTEGYLTISDDIPLAIDYTFKYWYDSDLNVYEPDDQIYVDGEIVLTAYWEEKTDDDSDIVRFFSTLFEAVSKYINKIISLMSFSQDFAATVVTTTTEETSTTVDETNINK
ncbi:MAG: hypothetical protein R3Y27_08245 [Clostridia bacterium]